MPIHRRSLLPPSSQDPQLMYDRACAIADDLMTALRAVAPDQRVAMIAVTKLLAMMYAPIANREALDVALHALREVVIADWNEARK